MRPIIPDVALGPRAEELSFCRSAQIRFDLTGVEQARRQTANGFSFDSRSVVLFSNLCLALLWGSLRVPRPEPFFFFCLQSVRYGARVTPDGSRENGADFKIWEEGVVGRLLSRASRSTIGHLLFGDGLQITSGGYAYNSVKNSFRCLIGRSLELLLYSL